MVTSVDHESTSTPGADPSSVSSRSPEVAILGASPAGLSAALAAAKAGARVHVLEGSQTIGVPEPPAKVAFLDLLPADLAPEPSELLARFTTVDLEGPTGSPMTIEAPGLVLDRTAFDRRLARQAQAAGATLHMDLGPVELTAAGTLVADELTLEAPWLVLADGHPSQAQALMDTVKDPTATRWGAIHRLEGQLPGGQDRLSISVGSQAPGGRTQLVPMGEGRFEHWTFAKRSPEETVELANQAAKQRAQRSPGLSLVDPEPVAVGPDPTHQVPGQLAGPGLVVAGGAGGLGGLEVGLRSGRWAGKAAAQAAAGGGQAALEAYEAKALGAFATGYRGLAQVMSLLEAMDDGAIDGLIEPWQDRLVDLDTLAGLSQDNLGARARSTWALARRHPSALLATVARLGRRPARLVRALRSA